MGQKVSLYQGLSLRENVEFYAGLYGLAGADARARAGARCASASRSRDAEGERPENLPAGIRQRAGLALATLHEPRVLFLDEPTAGVDVAQPRPLLGAHPGGGRRAASPCSSPRTSSRRSTTATGSSLHRRRPADRRCGAGGAAPALLGRLPRSRSRVAARRARRACSRALGAPPAVALDGATASASSRRAALDRRRSPRSTRVRGRAGAPRRASTQPPMTDVFRRAGARRSGERRA